MSKCIYINLGYPTQEGTILLSFWVDTGNESASRFMENGMFDVDQWEAEQVYIVLEPGANARTAWKQAWSMVRRWAREARCGWKLLDCAAPANV